MLSYIQRKIVVNTALYILAIQSDLLYAVLMTSHELVTARSGESNAIGRVRPTVCFHCHF